MGTHCEHQYLTVRPTTKGWICASCSVPMLSLSLPIPMPLIERAIAALAQPKEQP